jgi:hypothetical protein
MGEDFDAELRPSIVSNEENEDKLLLMLAVVFRNDPRFRDYVHNVEMRIGPAQFDKLCQLKELGFALGR